VSEFTPEDLQEMVRFVSGGVRTLDSRRAAFIVRLIESAQAREADAGPSRTCAAAERIMGHGPIGQPAPSEGTRPLALAIERLDFFANHEEPPESGIAADINAVLAALRASSAPASEPVKA